MSIFVLIAWAGTSPAHFTTVYKAATIVHLFLQCGYVSVNSAGERAVLPLCRSSHALFLAVFLIVMDESSCLWCID